MFKIHTPGSLASKATHSMGTFTDTSPDLIPTGLAKVDERLGGLAPGETALLGMCQGVGKSSTVLHAARNSSAKHGLIFLEDSVELTGMRLLAMETGIDSLKIRRKDLSADEKRQLREAQERLKDEDRFAVVCHPGGGIEDVRRYVIELGKMGCRMIVLDYIQKIRGIRDDRHNEVATAFTVFQAACAEVGAACMVTSQFSRQADMYKRPQRSWLKETGDLENEARLIVFGWRNAKSPTENHYIIDKSTFGGEGVTWTMRRTESGSLEEVDPYEEDFDG